jgi:hypothetical protein
MPSLKQQAEKAGIANFAEMAKFALEIAKAYAGSGNADATMVRLVYEQMILAQIEAHKKND